MLDIYQTQFKTTIAVMSQYRVYLVIWIMTLVTEPILYMTVWTIVSKSEGGSVGGYTAGDFAAYYITWMLVRHFVVTLSPDAIEQRVRQGEFSGLLMRPIHPVHVDIADNLGYKLVALPFVLLMMLGLALAFPPTYNLQPVNVVLFVLSVMIAFPIRFLSHWIIGLVAFWTTRAQAFFRILFVAEIFFTGRLAPLTILPEWVLTAASILPFRWMISFPVEVLLGKLSLVDMLSGLAAQVAWLGLMIGLLMVVWRACTRRYGAVGG